MSASKNMNFNFYEIFERNYSNNYLLKIVEIPLAGTLFLHQRCIDRIDKSSILFYGF